jgi:tetraacyldisaccharide 4'-kinase
MNPLTALYGAASGWRNSLFDHGWLRSRRLEQPVISVGGLSAGGAGKTPFVIALGEQLKARGVSFDVLSRGYRRKTRGVLAVETDGSAADFGDEPLLIARRLGVPVIVGERRYEAGRFAEQKFHLELHILDDGFQHRFLGRDFDIVLLTPDDFRDRLLPSGRLREPLSSLVRADVVVLPSGLAAEHPALQQKPIWRIMRELTLPPVPPAPITFCGLARPEQFFAQVRAAGITPATQLSFGDHHGYERSDIQRLLEERTKLQAGGFLTTEKDAVNLGRLQDELQPLTIAVLRLSLDHGADRVDTMLARITEPKARS